MVAALSCDEKKPRRSDNQKHHETENCGQQAKPVELTLSQVAAPDEDDVLASALRGDRREVAAGKEQSERH